MSQTEITRNETYKNRLALLLSMLEAGNPTEVVKVDHLSSQELAGSIDTDLTDICDGQGYNMHKLADKKYLGWRRA